MKRNKRIEHINIKRVKQYIKGTVLLGITTICLLYILYVIMASIYTYFAIRPLKLVALFIALGTLLEILVIVTDNKNKKTSTQGKHYKQ